MKAKAELERYMMREEEVERVIGQAVQTMLLQHFENSPNITKDEDYYYVRVKKDKQKPPPPPSQGMRTLKIRAEKAPVEEASAPVCDKSNPETKEPSGVEEQAGNDFEEMRE